MAVTTNISRILLRGGTILQHGADDHVVATVSDVLIEDGIITQVSRSIDVGETQTRVIDCASKIVSPGFINTHHHLWQTALKGRHGNHTLLEYFPRGNFVSSSFTVEDAFWGQLSGALEAIDAGTTTVLDHASLNTGPDSGKCLRIAKPGRTPLTPVSIVKASLQALSSSGLRAVYCYCVPRTVSSWSPLTFKDDYTSPWVLSTWKDLAASSPLANGRVNMGFAVDNLYMPTEEMQKLYQTLRSGGSKLITSHGPGGPSFGGEAAPSAIRLLSMHGVMGPDIVVSHSNFVGPAEAELLAQSGASISTTPNTELQMGWPPVALAQPEFNDHASLGVDCHSCGTGYMPYQMRLALQYARCQRSERLRRDNQQWSRHTEISVEDAFNMGTIAGARAMNMADQIGRIAEGLRADLVVFGTDSPSMLAAAEENPLSAVVLHSSERDVELVIVDGVVRKEAGCLVDVSVNPEFKVEGSLAAAGKKLTWSDIAREVRASRLALNKKWESIDMDAAEEVTMDAFHFCRSTMIERS